MERMINGIHCKMVETEHDVYFDMALNRLWQNGPFKHALLDAETPHIPASLLRRCAT